VNGLQAGAAAPTVDFTMTLDGQPFNAEANAAKLGALAFQIAGPVTDYAETLPNASGVASGLNAGALSTTATATRGTVVPINAAAGQFRFTFPGTPIPAGRTGVYIVTFETYYKETRPGPNDVGTISKPYAADPLFRGATKNVKYVNVATGAEATQERRLIVSNDKCNNCHEDIGFHSNRSRQGVDYCATCHNPNLSNAGRARFQVGELVAASSINGVPSGVTGDVFVAESVSTNVFIHKIHMGAELSRPYRLGTNRTATDRTPGADGLADFTEFTAPSPMGNCETCHVANSYRIQESLVGQLLPVRQAILGCPVQDESGWCSGPTGTGGAFSNVPVVGTLVTPPQKAVCGSCHDTPSASAHMDLNTIRPMTDQAIETCTTCHGEGAQFDAVRAHPPVLAPTVDLPD
jgi:OmcA/MtrC family decaheme c-type cytochrome